jgi:hypothetical protein
MDEMSAQSGSVAIPAVSTAAERTPARRYGSIRRTTSMQASWPDGAEQPVHLQGRGRDIFTPQDHGTPTMLLTDSLDVRMQIVGKLLSLKTSPERPELQTLVDDHAIRGYRHRLAHLLVQREDRERPLDTMLDDIAACSLVCGWALTLWPGSPYHEMVSGLERRRNMEGICIGHAPDPTGEEVVPGRSDPCAVGALQRADDPSGWHDLLPVPAMNMHRMRRIDLWRENALIQVDAMFQDSASSPDGGRHAIHDYALQATIDPVSWTVTDVRAQPRILPYPECPAAVGNIRGLIGTPVDALRSRVLADLRGMAGCTHLNDALRALAAVPWMVAQLQAQAGE